MCGIAGIVAVRGSGVGPELLRGMIATLRHRGPDETGVHVDGEAGLAHARLSIIDLSSGQQPMCNEDGSLWITFNGEIFNYVELREELVRKGHRFATRSDTEVILHAYEEKGEACVQDFNGQWAFAIWDAKKRKLFLSRDRLGVRPLFHTVHDGHFLFASEAKALFAYPGVPRRIDLSGLDEIFTFWFTIAPRTVFEGIQELPPGHSMMVQEGRVEVRCYWQPAYEVSDEFDGPASERRAAEQLRELLVDATRIRLRADVPVGAYLSGGLDSSVTAALIRRYTGAPLRTFSVTFEDPEFDESAYQEEVVRLLGTDHAEIRCSGGDIGEIFPKVVWHTEKPVVRTAPAPLFLLSRLVKQSGFKVVVTGEGSDEVLGGYDIYKEAKIRRFWAERPDSRWRPLLVKRLYPYLQNLQQQPAAYLRAFFHVKPDQLSNPLFSHTPRWELTSRLKALFSEEVRAELAGRDCYREMRARLPEAFESWPPFCRAQYLETEHLLPGYILSSQGDRMAMAHGVEGRYPFLDHRVVEFASKLPPKLKMKVLNEKYVLKLAAGDLVPRSVRQRPKQPYRAPDAQSFFGARPPEYLEDLLSPRAIRSGGLFDPAGVERLVQKAKAGQAIGVKDGMGIVGILSTQLVMHQFVNGFREVCYAKG